jgi:hypothetical protein
MTDMAFCPYRVPPHTDNPDANQANIVSWLRITEQHQREREAKRQTKPKSPSV